MLQALYLLACYHGGLAVEPRGAVAGISVELINVHALAFHKQIHELTIYRQNAR